MDLPMRTLTVTWPIPPVPCPDHPNTPPIRAAEPFGPWNWTCPLCGNTMVVTTVEVRPSPVYLTPMGTRSTREVGEATATYTIEAALKSGKLSRQALADMLEIVDDDLNTPEMSNFSVVEGQGQDDDFWVSWRESLSERA